MNRIAICAILLLAALVSTSGSARADGYDYGEQLLDYHTDIRIAANSDLDVTETLTMRVDRDLIHYGTHRDLPAKCRDLYGGTSLAQREILDVQIDGNPVPWHTEAIKGGTRLFLGDEQAPVAAGEHTYSLHYRVHDRIAFRADHDGLGWTVDKSAWDIAGTPYAYDFANASVDITLPASPGKSSLVAMAQASRFNGIEKQAMTTSVRDDGVTYAMDAPFKPNAVMAVTLEFPKGIVAAPGVAERIGWIKVVGGLRHGLLMAGLALLYYLLAWYGFGRDPRKGPPVAEYRPPDNCSAAMARYVYISGYDRTCFSAGLLGIAAKGGLRMDQVDGVHVVSKIGDDKTIAALTPDERRFRAALFQNGDTLRLHPSQQWRAHAATKALQSSLTAICGTSMVQLNRKIMLPGMALSLLAVWLLAGSNADTRVQLFILLVLGVGLGVVGMKIGEAWRNREMRTIGGMAPNTVIFGGMAILFCSGFVLLHGYPAVIVLLVLVAMNFAFWHWIEVPTPRTARLLRHLRNFRWYLSVTENRKLGLSERIRNQPELLGTYRAYAVALGVGGEWIKRFNRDLDVVKIEEDSPSWFNSTVLTDAPLNITTTTIDAQGAITPELRTMIDKELAAQGAGSDTRVLTNPSPELAAALDKFVEGLPESQVKTKNEVRFT